MIKYLLALSFLLAGCNSQQSAAVGACESFIKERLRSPSSYKQISVDDLGPSFKNDGRDIKMLTVEYDAANAYGTPIRGKQMCTFDVDQSGNFIDKDVEFAAKMASIRADSEYAPCCELNKNDRLSADPLKAADDAAAAAAAAMKAADEAIAAARKDPGGAK